MMNVAIMGFGTIGSGVYEALEANRQLIAEKVGQEIAVKYVLDLRDFPGTPVEDKIVHDFSRIVEDDDISIVVETMGGLNPAYPFVKACLLAGKHVATSNKALVAAYGTELLAVARRSNHRPVRLLPSRHLLHGGMGRVLQRHFPVHRV